MRRQALDQEEMDKTVDSPMRCRCLSGLLSMSFLLVLVFWAYKKRFQVEKGCHSATPLTSADHLLPSCTKFFSFFSTIGQQCTFTHSASAVVGSLPFAAVVCRDVLRSTKQHVFFASMLTASAGRYTCGLSIHNSAPIVLPSPLLRPHPWLLILNYAQIATPHTDLATLFSFHSRIL